MLDMGLNLRRSWIALPFIDNRNVEKSWTVIIDLAPRYVLYRLCCVVLWQYILCPLLKHKLASHLQTAENNTKPGYNATIVLNISKCR